MEKLGVLGIETGRRGEIRHRYEAVFYGALSLELISWILVENTLTYSSKVKRSSSSFSDMEDNVILDGRYSDVRIPLIFMVLFNAAFFGTGNFASIANFEISSVYQFITVFSVSEG
ncbi:GPI ethanolamine phosphate transferase 1 [Pyrus ussuriensis x Pyrus communis]|uniref:GPI ethanolamine phosphate transferase 1 n=1 Tax=Pyrus ussuriensis x Pyrus communis TaxID=2448454 RepID=A0A5N5F7H7_9ROSA|nr:GPI ethanolamine phosphate transferase 1 [Pyrus ussuriensis x Pyrus communis]